MHPGIVAAIAAVAVFAVSFGVTFPLFALILERAGASETFIGLNTAMTPLGILVSAPLVPWAAARVNAVVLAAGSGLATAVLIGAFALTAENLAWWFPLRFALGVAINVLFVLSETWINQLAPPRARGRVMGIYVTTLAACFAVGPLTVAAAGTHGLVPFAIAGATSLVVVPVLWAARRHLPEFPGGTARGLWSFAYGAPLLLTVCAAIALFDQTTLSLLPIYALRTGLDEAGAAIAISVLIAGNVAMQIPIGWLADIYPRRALLAILVGMVVAGAVLLPVCAGGDAFWPLLFVWGGAGYGAYTVTVAELGARFSGAMLLAGNAAFAVMWGAGGMVGPALTGAAMDILGADGLPLTLGIVFAAIAIAVVRRPLVPERAHHTGEATARQAASERR